jgi:hypothetical protein
MCGTLYLRQKQNYYAVFRLLNGGIIHVPMYLYPFSTKQLLNKLNSKIRVLQSSLLFVSFLISDCKYYQGCKEAMRISDVGTTLTTLHAAFVESVLAINFLCSFFATT